MLGGMWTFNYGLTGLRRLFSAFNHGLDVIQGLGILILVGIALFLGCAVTITGILGGLR